MINEGVVTEQKAKSIGTNGAMACFEQFHLLSQYFQKSSAAHAYENVCMSERANFRLQTVKLLQSGPRFSYEPFHKKTNFMDSA